MFRKIFIATFLFLLLIIIYVYLNGGRKDIKSYPKQITPP